MKTEHYDGPVCFLDGWHWSTIVDEDDRARCVTVAQAHVDYAHKRGDGDSIAAAEAELARATSATYEVPDRKLFLEDDGTYRFATDSDSSWRDRKHTRFATIAMDGGEAGLQVSAEEFAEIQKMLDAKRGGKA